MLATSEAEPTLDPKLPPLPPLPADLGRRTKLLIQDIASHHEAYGMTPEAAQAAAHRHTLGTVLTHTSEFPVVAPAREPEADTPQGWFSRQLARVPHAMGHTLIKELLFGKATDWLEDRIGDIKSLTEAEQTLHDRDLAVRQQFRETKRRRWAPEEQPEAERPLTARELRKKAREEEAIDAEPGARDFLNLLTELKNKAD